jgi:DNA-binding transcriptional MocR family regulator
MLKDDSLYKHVQYLKQVHSDRLYNGLIEPIQNELEPLGCKLVLLPRGGYFVWLKLPITVDTLNDTIASHHIEVGVGPGRRFRVNSDDPYHVRLSFAHYNTNDLKLGISRLKQAITLALK